VIQNTTKIASSNAIIHNAYSFAYIKRMPISIDAIPIYTSFGDDPPNIRPPKISSMLMHRLTAKDAQCHVHPDYILNAYDMLKHTLSNVTADGQTGDMVLIFLIGFNDIYMHLNAEQSILKYCEQYGLFLVIESINCTFNFFAPSFYTVFAG